MITDGPPLDACQVCGAPFDILHGEIVVLRIGAVLVHICQGCHRRGLAWAREHL